MRTVCWPLIRLAALAFSVGTVVAFGGPEDPPLDEI
jgi:hypothetical protein